jgi:hypothetical protein
MKTNLFQLGLAACFSGALLTACTPEIDAPEISAGSANFSKYVALGNSLTAGFADGALYREGQLVSYPNLLAQQFKLAGGGEFNQPLLAEGVSYGSPFQVPGSFIPLVPTKFKLSYASPSCGGDSSLSPVFVGPPVSFNPFTQFANDPNDGPFQNLGVPGAKSTHLLAPGYGDPAGLAFGTANPFFIRFTTSTTASVLADAVSQDPTFFTLWIGNNDVLGYALAGGGSATITPAAGAPGVGFDGTIDSLVHALTHDGAKGAIANIPDVYKAPYFTTIPYNGLLLTSQTQVDALNTAYAPLGITFNLGANAFVIKDASAPGGMRQIKAGEYILLPVSDSLKCRGYGSQAGIPEKFVLTESEVSQIKTAIASYNSTIATIANEHGLALVDMHSYFNQIISGIQISGVGYNSAFVSGGVFSLDGLHFNDKGSALVANQFIRSINTKFGASIPTLNLNQYKGIRFP